MRCNIWQVPSSHYMNIPFISYAIWTVRNPIRIPMFVASALHHRRQVTLCQRTHQTRGIRRTTLCRHEDHRWVLALLADMFFIWMRTRLILLFWYLLLFVYPISHQIIIYIYHILSYINIYIYIYISCLSLCIYIYISILIFIYVNCSNTRIGDIPMSFDRRSHSQRWQPFGTNASRPLGKRTD